MAKPTEKQKTQFLELLSCGLSFSEAAIQAGCHKQDFYRLAVEDQDFDGLLSRAREKQQESLVDEMRELANNCDESNVNSTKLKIWAAQWVAAKRAPRKYGDRLDIKSDNKTTLEVGDSVSALMAKIRSGENKRIN